RPAKNPSNPSRKQIFRRALVLAHIVFGIRPDFWLADRKRYDINTQFPQLIHFVADIGVAWPSVRAREIGDSRRISQSRPPSDSIVMTLRLPSAVMKLLSLRRGASRLRRGSSVVASPTTIGLFCW